MHRNLRLLVRCFEDLKSRHSGLAGLLVAADASIASIIRKKLKTFPGGLHMVTDQRDIAIAWCDMGIAVSGTITLHLARQIKPMIGVYKTDPLSWLGAKLMLRTHYKLLPNIIAETEIVPEYVPYIGGARPIVDTAARVFNDSRNAAEQTNGLAQIISRFTNKHFADEGAVLILKTIKDGAAPLIDQGRGAHAGRTIAAYDSRRLSGVYPLRTISPDFNRLKYEWYAFIAMKPKISMIGMLTQSMMPVPRSVRLPISEVVETIGRVAITIRMQ